MILTEEQIRSDIAKSPTNGVSYEGISNEDYHKGPGVSSSNIKTVLNKTFGHYLEEKKNPKDPTPALRLGTAIHTRILEPDLYEKNYLTEMPAVPARRGESKKIYEEWEKENLDLVVDKYKGKLTSDQWAKEYMNWKNPGMEFVSPSDVEIIEGIYKSWSEHSQIQKIFTGGIAELSIYWIDKITGLLCKCRPDYLNKKWPCLADIKSCMNGGLDEFEGDITTHDYHISAAWYLWGCMEAFGFNFEDFVYVPCEKSSPYTVTFYPADQGSLDLGKGLYMAGLQLFKRHFDAIERDEKPWLGHSRKVKPAGVRPWAMNKLSQIIYKHDLQSAELEHHMGV